MQYSHSHSFSHRLEVTFLQSTISGIWYQVHVVQVINFSRHFLYLFDFKFHSLLDIFGSFYPYTDFVVYIFLSVLASSLSNLTCSHFPFLFWSVACSERAVALYIARW